MVKALLFVLPVSTAVYLMTVGVPVAAAPTVISTASTKPAAAVTSRSAGATHTGAVVNTTLNTGNAPAVTPGAAIGALFTVGPNGLENHFCSASVVHSAAGDLVLTAAHCIHDGSGGSYHTDIAFVPGYHDHVAPYGVWTVNSEFVSPDWISSSDPDEDYGFLVVHRAGTSKPIESFTGANQLGINRGFTSMVTISGYPNTTDSPVTCQNQTTQQATYQMHIDCPGFPAGTSGGPWVIDSDPITHLGTVIGVIGGYQLGGDNPDTSYSSYFDADVQHLYDMACAAG